MEQQEETSDTALTAMAKQVATPIADVFSEFLHVTLLQLVQLRFEVATLKGQADDEAQAHAVSFLQDFELLREMLESQGLDWQAFKVDLQAAAQGSAS